MENKVFGDVADAKKPKKTNQRYYPSYKDLRNHIARVISAQKYCDDYQESLRLKISDWKERSPQTRFFYRTRDDPPASSEPTGKNSSEESTFLFVHQEPWQQRLLERYGSQLVLMDATYYDVRHTTFLYLHPHKCGIYRCHRIYVSDGRPSFDKRSISHSEDVKSRLES